MNERDWFDYVGLAVAVVGALGAAQWFWSRWDRRLEAHIADPEYRTRLVERHDCRAAVGYYLSLQKMLKWIENFYGPTYRTKAFLRCIQLAFIYPILATLLGWVVVNQAAPGGLTLFADVSGFPGRLWRALVLVMSILTTYWIFSNIETWSEKARRRAKGPERPAKVRKALDGRVLHLLSSLLKWTSVVSLLVFAFAVIAAGALAGAVVFVFAISAAAALAVSAAFAFAGAFAVAAAISRDATTAGLIGFLYLLLPLSNAVADWVSLAFTRSLLEDMERRRPGAWGLALHLLVDILAGLACLCLLLTTLVGLLEIWAIIHPSSVPFDWRAYWQAARQAPSEGLALWLMAFTTLLPTLVHLVWAITVWRTQKSDHTHAAVAKMRALTDTPSEAQRIEIASLIQRGQISGALRGTLYWGLPLAALLWLAYSLIHA